MIFFYLVAELNGADALLCDRASFDYNVYNYCLPIYNEVMASVNYQDLCPWPSTQRHYFFLDDCVQQVVKMTACTEPSLRNQIFLDLHRTYFFQCPFLKDPDEPVLLLLILPCIILTFLFPLFCSHFTIREYSISE